MNRQEKLAKLKKATARKAPKSIEDYTILADAMEEIVADFKAQLKKGVEITDLDILLDRLGAVRELSTEVSELKTAIANFPKLPEEVKIASVNEFLDAVRDIKIQPPDVVLPETKQPPDYSASVEKLAKAVLTMATTLKTKDIPHGQRPEDFVPYRRVIKKGNSFVFDDAQGSGGGLSTGGRGVPARSASGGSGLIVVPVANADGTPIAGTSGGALETTQLGVKADLDYRYSGGKTAVSRTIAASGNTDLIVPAAGHHLEIYWISFIPNSDNVASNLVKLGFGTSLGAITTELYRSYAMAHWELFVGGTDQAFIINTGTAEPVAVTVHYKEI